MAQKPALFVAHVGPAGYMPDSTFGPYVCPSRRELAATVDSVLRQLDCSARARRGVNLVDVWREIQARGNGAAGFTLEDPTTRTRVHFHNLTPGELVSWDDGDE